MASESDHHTARKKLSMWPRGTSVTVVLLLVVALAGTGFYRFVSGNRRAKAMVASLVYFLTVPPVDDTVPTTEPTEVTTQALIVLDSATRVHRDPGAYGSYHVAYAVSEIYPASNSIKELSSRLRARGWTPLEEDWLNPGVPSAHMTGWVNFRNDSSTPASRVHAWSAQWQDQSGSIVCFNLRYSYPVAGKQNLQTLWVNGSWYPASGVKTMKMATKLL